MISRILSNINLSLPKKIGNMHFSSFKFRHRLNLNKTRYKAAKYMYNIYSWKADSALFLKLLKKVKF